MPGGPLFHGVASLSKLFLYFLFLRVTCENYFCSLPVPVGNSASASSPKDPFAPAPSHELPPRLLIGYANWAQCDRSFVRAVRQGLNVVIWFSINLSRDAHGNPSISGAVPDLDCVARTAAAVRAANLSVTHMISIGGWNSPLPDASFSAAQWFRVFDAWNRGSVARPKLGWGGFDGIDWDAEGNDDTTNPANVFDAERVRLIGELSLLAKRAGYFVSLAPAQSYLNAFTQQFSLRVNFAPLRWKPDFKYHGRNLYAVWLSSKYGTTKLASGATVSTFDWVGLQLYEGWSDANYHITVNKTSPTDYLHRLMQAMSDGWQVRFSDEPRLNISTSIVHVSPTRLVIGLANGWTKSYPPPQKFLLLQPNQLAEAYSSLPDGLKPRGFMFWNIGDEGKVVDGKEFYLSEELNKFLYIRQTAS